MMQRPRGVHVALASGPHDPSPGPYFASQGPAQCASPRFASPKIDDETRCQAIPSRCHNNANESANESANERGTSGRARENNGGARVGTCAPRAMTTGRVACTHDAKSVPSNHARRARTARAAMTAKATRRARSRYQRHCARPATEDNRDSRRPPFSAPAAAVVPSTRKNAPTPRARFRRAWARDRAAQPPYGRRRRPTDEWALWPAGRSTTASA